MAKAEIDLNDLIRKDIASKILETIPIEQRQQILENSLTKTLEEVLHSYNVERAIRVDVEEYMTEYIKDTEVQERIRKATFSAVDKLMDGVIKAIVIGAQENLQSTYRKLVKEEEK